MKTIFRCGHCLGTVSLVVLLVMSCKKTKDQPESSILDKISLEGVRSQNVGQFGFTINYTTEGPVSITGVCISSDSSMLVSSPGEEVVAMLVTKNNYIAKVDFSSFPKTNKIFYKVYVQDASGYRHYSQVYGHRLALMVVRNPYIVHGLAVYNTHTTKSFYDYDEGPYGGFDNSLSIMTALNDVVPENYKAFLNGTTLRLDTLIPGTKNEIRHRLIFDVPREIPFGQNTLELYHKHSLVTREQVQIVAGGLLTRQTRYLTKELKGSYAVFGDEVYNYASSGAPVSDAHFFYKWLPKTNQWTKLQDPPLATPTWYGNAMQELDGALYLFPYVSENGRLNYEEYMLSYHIASGKWRKKVLYAGSNYRPRMEVQDSFAYQGKVYWIATESNSIVNDIIISYDPSTDTYERFYQLPHSEGATYKATVLNGKVYLLRSGTRSSWGSTFTSANEFFELNISGKKLVPKSWFADKVQRQWIIGNNFGAGYLESYLVSHHGKIYAYGGRFEREYFNRHMTLFVVYDPATDQWSPVSGYSFYMAKVSQTEGHMLSLDDKLYLLHGINGAYDNYGSSGGDRHGHVYTISVR